VSLYLHRGAFENALADEDAEQDPDRWCSHSAWGKARMADYLSMGVESPPGTGASASSCSGAHDRGGLLRWRSELPPRPPHRAMDREHAPYPGKQAASRVVTRVPQPDGTLRCPAGQSLRVHERRREADGSLRVVYAESRRSCRPCPLRDQCQWQGRATRKPRQVSMLLHPLAVGAAPLLWRDWSRRQPRRACMQLRYQRLEVQMEPALSANPVGSPAPLSRAQRAHYRLSFQERLARNARAPTAAQVTIKLFGIPETFAAFLGLPTA
jgi:hypothetical protein